MVRGVASLVTISNVPCTRVALVIMRVVEDEKSNVAVRRGVSGVLQKHDRQCHKRQNANQATFALPRIIPEMAC